MQMKYRPRIYYTETDKALMWDRWQKGESLNSIARHFDRHHSAIQRNLYRTGGIRPPKRRRPRLACQPVCVQSLYAPGLRGADSVLVMVERSHLVSLS
jgi:hypothetical protein